MELVNEKLAKFLVGTFCYYYYFSKKTLTIHGFNPPKQALLALLGGILILTALQLGTCG